MEHTRLPFTTWFLAIQLICQAKTCISALALMRDLGVSYRTARLQYHKINNAIARQEQAHRLDGFVQLDGAYLGGERSIGRVGRGSGNEVLFVAAVSLNAAIKTTLRYSSIWLALGDLKATMPRAFKALNFRKYA